MSSIPAEQAEAPAVMGRVMSIVARVTGIVCILSLSVMIVSILINVFFRYVLNSPLAWPSELSRFMVVAVTLLGSSLAVRSGAHVGVTVFVTRLPVRMQAVVFLFGNLLIFGFLMVLLWKGFELAFLEGPRQTAPSMGISMMFAFIPLPLGALLMALHLAEYTAMGLRRVRVGKSPFDTNFD